MPSATDAESGSTDRLLLATRSLALVIIPVLIAAFVLLFGFPGDTKRLWAWTIHPNVTCLIIGAAYLAGAWFFIRTVYDGRWHRVSVGWLAVIPFTALLELATFLHWDKFNHHHVSFWSWFLLYTVTPIALPALWVMNRKAAGQGRVSFDLQLPRPLRGLVAAGGAVLLVAASAIYVRPKTAIVRWPWALTPLTARTLASFATFLAVVWITFAFTGQWSRLSIPFEATTVGLVMVTVAVARGHHDLVSGSRSQIFIVLLAATVTGSIALVVWANAHRTAA